MPEMISRAGNQFGPWVSNIIEGSIQEHYPIWVESAWLDSDGVLFGWYHHEPIGLCGEGSILTAPEIGAVVSFDVKGGKDAAWRVVDSTRLLSITANLGDTKSTITHPASTTHGRISAEARAAAGIGDGLLRVAVGLEAVADIKADLARGLDA